MWQRCWPGQQHPSRLRLWLGFSRRVRVEQASCSNACWINNSFFRAGSSQTLLKAQNTVGPKVECKCMLVRNLNYQYWPHKQCQVSVMRHRVVWYMFTDFAEDPAVSFLRVRSWWRQWHIMKCRFINTEVCDLPSVKASYLTTVRSRQDGAAVPPVYKPDSFAENCSLGENLWNEN